MIRDELMQAGPRRRGLTALVATALPVGAVVALAASCAAGGPEDTGAPPSARPPPPPTGQPDREPPPSLEPNEVVVEPAIGLRRLPWTRVEAVGQRRLRVHAVLTGGPPCAVLGRVDVREDDHEVTLTLWVGRRPDTPCDGPQRAIGLPIMLTVDLRAPLGERRVRDGA